MIDNFNELVKRCKQRRRTYVLRQLFKIFSVIFILTALIVGYYYAFMVAQKPTISTSVTTPKPHIQSIVEENRSVQTALSTASAASLPVRTPAPLASVPVTPAGQPIAPKAAASTVIAAKAPADFKNNALLEVTNVTVTSENLTESFQKYPKYDTALTLANDFYAKKNYEQSAIWAKKANQMNREAEEAWLLYAKSYYAQGRKSEAVGILELYLNYKDSKAALELLKSWKTTP